MLLIIGKQQWSTNQYWSTLFINSSRQNEIKQYKKNHFAAQQHRISQLTIQYLQNRFSTQSCNIFNEPL